MRASLLRISLRRRLLALSRWFMADEHIPAPTPQSSTGFSAPSEHAPPAAVNGEIPPHDGDSARKPASSVQMPEMMKILRMILGYLIVGACGWGLIGLVFYLVHSSERSHLFLGATAALDLILFIVLEKDFRLSRFMGLRIEPGGHPWHSAILLWLLGVPGLLFRSTDLQPQAEAASRTATRTRSQPMPQGDSFREIVETIVFVVVLVLLLKSFAAEAFVIPTGSMAQTLLGYQKEVECPDCGLKFPVNCSQEVDPNEGKPSPVYACICPNCRQRIHFRTRALPEFYERNFPDSIAVDDPGWNSGDRVLVAKFVYDLLGKSPNRLDVVVFKFPGNPDFPASGPYKNHVPMNYIKRLIGLPGETIAIRGGNLYCLRPDKGPRYGDYEKAKSDPELMATLWKKEWMHVNEARDLFAQGQFQIIRKNPENILSMMRLVYDNDHPSKDARLPQRWEDADRAWTEEAPHSFRIGDDGQNQTHWLTYQNLLRDDKGNPSLILDFMGYNSYQTQIHSPLMGANWVGDLILECEAAVDEPRGELMLELAKGVDRFQARWDLATGVCTLLRWHDGMKEELDSKPTSLNKKGAHRLRFANVDERLTVWVNGELPFDAGVSYSPPQRIAPTEENDLRRPARIGVRGGNLAVRKMKLFRDTYYTVGAGPDENPRDSDVGGIEPTKPDSWHKLDDPPVLTMYVQPDHFLCLGDNSPESSDGRAWGSVPRRLLLGRALLVYYPFGRAGRIR